jgi:predicted RNA-binding Zn ribbon-like protein
MRPFKQPPTPAAQELRFIFRSGRLCLAFCATVGERWRCGFERLLTPGHLARWYAEAAVTSVPLPVTGPDLAEARALREAVYRTAKALLGGQPAGADEETINRAAAAPPPVPRMGPGAVVLAAAGPDPAASALSAVARDAIGLFTTADARRIRECASPECGLLFLDLSRPGRRRWCSSNACGGKARAAAYRQRHQPPAETRLTVTMQNWPFCAPKITASRLSLKRTKSAIGVAGRWVAL